MDPAKIRTISNLLVPKDVAGLQHMLGLFQHYAKFHPSYAATAAPLTDLTQKGRPWCWTERCQEAFEAIKAVLVSAPILMRLDFSKPFIVQTDWSPRFRTEMVDDLQGLAWETGPLVVETAAVQYGCRAQKGATPSQC